MNKTIHSIRYPFAIDRQLGALMEENNYASHVRQLMLQVLFTNPGERINRPDFGCGIRRMVFAPNSDATASMTQVLVMEALEKWLGSVIQVNNVQVAARDEKLEVNIQYTIKVLQEQAYLNIAI